MQDKYTKNLGEISIGNSRFSVECKSSKPEDGIVYIQNKTLSYSMKKHDFVHLVAEILRSLSEIDYIKGHPDLTERIIENGNEIHFDWISDDLQEFMAMCEKMKIDFRLVEEGKGYATLLVNPASKKEFKKILDEGSGITKLEHPYGKLFGYSFLYQMNEFSFCRYKNTYIEIFYQLPCMSETPKTWIPLDSAIQKRIWKTNTTRLDSLSWYIYRLCYAIFKDRGFSKSTLTVLEHNTFALDDPEAEPLLSKVFFGFTKNLIKLLKNKEYNSIIKEYLSYTDY